MGILVGLCVVGLQVGLGVGALVVVGVAVTPGRNVGGIVVIRQSG